MNKRIKKKMEKRLGARTYYEGRRRQIIQDATRCFENTKPNEYCSNAVLIIDSKKGNLKHPHNILPLKNMYPSAMSSDFDLKKSEIEKFTLEFQATLFHNPIVDKVAESLLPKIKTNNKDCE